MNLDKFEKLIVVIFYAILILGAIILIGTIYAYYSEKLICFSSTIDHDKIGSFGDFIGGFIGTLFTIAATLLIWLTYNSQKKELAKTNELAEKQFENLAIQQFENTFFNMATTLMTLPNSIEGNIPQIYKKERPSTVLYLDEHVRQNKIYRGTTFFIQATENLIKYFNIIFEEKENIYKSDIETTYQKFYDKSLDELDNYFRYFYNILKFIDNSNIRNKKRYADILQAQLSKYELALIFYNGLSITGSKKLFHLLTKYNFLENVNPSVLYKKNGNPLSELYPNITFRFLGNQIIIQKILLSIKDNCDKINFENDSELYEYYLTKHNCDSKIILELKAALDKIIKQENSTIWANNLFNYLKIK